MYIPRVASQFLSLSVFPSSPVDPQIFYNQLQLFFLMLKLFQIYPVGFFHAQGKNWRPRTVSSNGQALKWKISPFLLRY